MESGLRPDAAALDEHAVDIEEGLGAIAKIFLNHRLEDITSDVDRRPWEYLTDFRPASVVSWGLANISRRLHGSHLTPPTTDYDPIRRVVLRPDEVLDVKTDLGVMPAYIYNRDALGNGDKPDLYSHSPLFTRADQGIQSPMIHSLDLLVNELDMGMVVIGAPGSSYIPPTPSQLNRTDLSGMVLATQQVIEGVADQTGEDLTRQIHRGSSLGGYITLGLCAESVNTGANIELAIPEAPAGWHLRHHIDPRKSQVMGAIKQFWPILGPEVAHVLDSSHSIRIREGVEKQIQYFQALGETAPVPTAILTHLAITRAFLTGGNLEEVIADIPRDLRIRGVAFTEDFVTLPHVLTKHINAANGFTDAIIVTKVGAHLSLKSMRKVFETVTEEAIRELCDPNYTPR